MNIRSISQDILFETQAVRLFRELEMEILAGKFEPGERLVRRDISKRFGLSQATVSEALWRLESEGLVESAPMYGTRITQLTAAKVKDETVLREALECQVARVAAEELRPADLPRLGELADKVDALLRSPGSNSRTDMETHQEFHLALAQLTGSLLLLREVERLWRRHFLFFTWMSGKVWPSPAHWHRSLLDAIASGDPDTAERAMREHVLYGSNHQMDVLASFQRQQEAAVGTPG